MSDAPDTQLEHLLQHARPTPATAWTASLERDLLPRRTPQRRWLPAAVAASALALVLFGATLAGGGPLASHGGDAARAKPGCDVVYITRIESVGEVRRQADGSVRVETTRRPVPRAVERCR